MVLHHGVERCAPGAPDTSAGMNSKVPSDVACVQWFGSIVRRLLRGWHKQDNSGKTEKNGRRQKGYDERWKQKRFVT